MLDEEKKAKEECSKFVRPQEEYRHLKTSKEMPIVKSDLTMRTVSLKGKTTKLTENLGK